MGLESANIPPPHHERVLGGQGWVGLVQSMGNEATIVNAARVSFGKRKDAIEEDDLRLLRYLIRHRHTTPFEHVVFTFLVHCPLYVRSQWHRHRTWSFNEISRRYTSADIEFYLPPMLRGQADDNRQASVEAPVLHQEELQALIAEHHRRSLDLYQRLLDGGVCREQARGVLPQNMFTTFWGTVDLHNLLHFLELRDAPEAQWEIREYAQAMKRLVRPVVPNVARILGWDRSGEGSHQALSR